MRQTIGVVGGGNMGTAIIQGIYKLYPVSVCEQSVARRQFLRQRFNIHDMGLRTLVLNSDVIIVAVKPQDIEPILKEIAKFITQDKLLISIAAGITISYIQKKMPPKTKVIRTMPNMPAQIARGITAICKGKHAKRNDMVLARKIFVHVGQTITVKEDLIDAITAVSGSGPAYVFLFVECLIKAAKSLGLSHATSQLLVAATVTGSVDLLKLSKDSPAQLRAKVTSKGGTTQAATDVFTKNKFDKIFVQALKAAKKRAKQIAKK